jgi:thiamine biosynthesis lipoprotein
MITVERFDAMGTWIEVRASTSDGHRAVRRLFERMEARFSRFLSSSELSLVNANPQDQISVSNDLAEVLSAAADLGTRTGGIVDPAVGGRVIEWGYDRTFDSLSPAGAPIPSWDRPTWRIDGSIVHRSPGTRLDLGGIAKGWTADRAVDLGFASVVSAGGDLRSSDPDTTVDIVDPWGATPVRLSLGVGGLATSSISRRRWESAGGPAHHIIDPRTGDPAHTPVVSATVIAATAAEAEAGAKSVLIRGVEGLAWARRQPWIRSALVVWHDGNVFATPGVEVAA